MNATFFTNIDEFQNSIKSVVTINPLSDPLGASETLDLLTISRKHMI